MPKEERSLENDYALIYKLIDPRDNSIFYIGQTYWALNARLNGHLNEQTPSKKKLKLQEIKQAGMKPIIEPIERLQLNWFEKEKCFAKIREREKYWIEWHREQGHKLLNRYPIVPGEDIGTSPVMLRKRLAQLTEKERRLEAMLQETREKKAGIENHLENLQEQD